MLFRSQKENMILDYQKSTSFVVRELLLKAEKPSFSLVIGIPRENQEVEKRLALTPESVALLVAAGYRVLLQAGAGLTINYSDSYYAESGAEIVETAQSVFQADLVLKVLPPTLAEVQMMRQRSTVFSFLYLHRLSKPLLELMQEKKISALAYELMYDDTGVSPFVTSISEIEGATSITQIGRAHV